MVKANDNCHKRDQEALKTIETLLDDLVTFYPEHIQKEDKGFFIYFSGVCRYKQTHDGGPLKEVYEKLKDNYPNTEWAQRASPYRLL